MTSVVHALLEPLHLQVLHVREPKPPRALSHEQLTPFQPLFEWRHDWHASLLPVSRAMHADEHDGSVLPAHGPDALAVQIRSQRLSGVSFVSSS